MVLYFWPRIFQTCIVCSRIFSVCNVTASATNSVWTGSLTTCGHLLYIYSVRLTIVGNGVTNYRKGCNSWPSCSGLAVYECFVALNVTLCLCVSYSSTDATQVVNVSHARENCFLYKLAKHAQQNMFTEHLPDGVCNVQFQSNVHVLFQSCCDKV